MLHLLAPYLPSHESSDGSYIPFDWLLDWPVVVLYVGGLVLAAVIQRRVWFAAPLAFCWPMLLWLYIWLFKINS